VRVLVAGETGPGSNHIAPHTGRTTTAVLFCEKEGAWNRHRFLRENRMQGGVAGRHWSVELIFACACGAERRWGWEDR